MWFLRICILIYNFFKNQLRGFHCFFNLVGLSFISFVFGAVLVPPINFFSYITGYSYFALFLGDITGYSYFALFLGDTAANGNLGSFLSFLLGEMGLSASIFFKRAFYSFYFFSFSSYKACLSNCFSRKLTMPKISRGP